MVKRSVNSPWGNVYKEGLPSTAVDDKTEVDQEVRPVINTGSIDVRTGKWEGVTLSDENFRISEPAIGIPNGAAIQMPNTANHQYIDMTGFNDLFVAIHTNNQGNIAMQAVMGLSTDTFANLTPLNGAAGLRGQVVPGDQGNLLSDTGESIEPDLWNIYYIGNVLRGQKRLQFKITNTNMGDSTINFAYLRAV